MHLKTIFLPMLILLKVRLGNPFPTSNTTLPTSDATFESPNTFGAQMDMLYKNTEELVSRLKNQLQQLKKLKQLGIFVDKKNLTKNMGKTHAASCLEANVNTDGIYTIKVTGMKPFSVACDANIAGAGWMVIQRRVDDSLSFYRNWSEYRRGFGNLSGNFFIGLEKLHALTATQSHELYIHLEDFNGEKHYARYQEFAISKEINAYSINALGDYTGTAGDSLRVHESMKFTTYDRDNDNEERYNCAVAYAGAWWYNECLESNLNGVYLGGNYDVSLSGRGICWEGWHGFEYSYKTVVMLIRPRLLPPRQLKT